MTDGKEWQNDTKLDINFFSRILQVSLYFCPFRKMQHPEPQIIYFFALKPTEHTGQKMKFSIKDFSSKCNQIRRELRIWWHLLKKS